MSTGHPSYADRIRGLVLHDGDVTQFELLRAFSVIAEAFDACEAEREATEQPPTPAPAEDVVDEPGVGAVVRDRHGDLWTNEGTYWSSPETVDMPWERIVRKYGPLTLTTPARPTPTPQPDTAPDEGAVEALADALIAMQKGWRNEYAPTIYDLARAGLAALDRGAIPGYGPTGASGGAGEVVAWAVKDEHGHALYESEPTDEPDRFPLYRAALGAS